MALLSIPLVQLFRIYNRLKYQLLFAFNHPANPSRIETYSPEKLARPRPRSSPPRRAPNRSFQFPENRASWHLIRVIRNFSAAQTVRDASGVARTLRARLPKKTAIHARCMRLPIALTVPQSRRHPAETARARPPCPARFRGFGQILTGCAAFGGGRNLPSL